MINCINARGCFVNNFNVTLKSVEYKKKKIYNSYLFYFLKIIPFYFIKSVFNYFDVKYIYKIDNLYLSNYSETKIMPFILNVSVFNNDNEYRYNIKDKIKKYTPSIPLWYILSNEKIDDYDSIEFKHIQGSKILNIKNIENKLLNDIFNKNIE